MFLRFGESILQLPVRKAFMFYKCLAGFLFSFWTWFEKFLGDVGEVLWKLLKVVREVLDVYLKAFGSCWKENTANTCYQTYFKTYFQTRKQSVLVGGVVDGPPVPPIQC